MSGVMLGIADAGIRRPEFVLLHHPAARREAFIAASCLAVVALGNEEETAAVARIAKRHGIAAISTTPGLDVPAELNVVGVTPRLVDQARSAARFARAREWTSAVTLSSTADRDAVGGFVEGFGRERVQAAASADEARDALALHDASVLVVFPSAERELVVETLGAVEQSSRSVSVVFVSPASVPEVTGADVFVVAREPLPEVGAAFDVRYRSVFHRETTSDAVLGHDAGLLVARALWAGPPTARLGLDVVRVTWQKLVRGDRLAVSRSLHAITDGASGATLGAYWYSSATLGVRPQDRVS
ncbi:MAG: hypothetical protein KC464_20695 [Myxococcales bacterium]|nr:hypothetical protein [Myxococcales bacterium]